MGEKVVPNPDAASPSPRRRSRRVVNPAAVVEQLRAALLATGATAGALTALGVFRAATASRPPELLWLLGATAALGVLAGLLPRLPSGLAAFLVGVAPIAVALGSFAAGGTLEAVPGLLMLNLVVLGLLERRPLLPALGVTLVALGLTGGHLALDTLGPGGGGPLDGSTAMVAAAAAGLGALALILIERRRTERQLGELSEQLAAVEELRRETEQRAAALLEAERDLEQRESVVRGDTMYHQVLESATDVMLLEDHERQQTIHAVVESSRDWIWAMSLDGRLLYSNGAVREILGREPDEVIGMLASDLMHPEDRAAIVERMPTWIAEKRAWKDRLTRWTHASGETRYLESSAVPILGIDGDIQGFRGVDRDVTERIAADAERRRLEEQVRQGQKMEAIGALAGGVAHDFNNILQAIVSTTSMASLHLPPDAPCQEDLSQIETAARSAAELTRQLLAFSRQQVLQRRVVSVDRLVSGFLVMLRRVIGEDIALAYEPCPEPVQVLADAGQVEQVLLNLCVNARDALHRGGTIRVSVGITELGEAFCAGQSGLKPGRFATLRVADDGAGMDAATQARIFEPFYTTKGLGKGTGLGLSTVYGIVKQHGGAVEVTSEIGVGSTFTVYLPITDDPLPDTPTPITAVAPRGAETILLAEDEELVRTLATRLLQSGGYRVLVAEDGAAAVALLEAHASEVDLLVLDVVMPRLSGPEVERAARTLAPNAKVLFTTGYAALEREERFEDAEAFQLLAKPYSRAALLAKVREVLDHK